MKIRIVLAVLILMSLVGCLKGSLPEEVKAQMRIVRMDMMAAGGEAGSYYAKNGRWPETIEELYVSLRYAVCFTGF